MCLGRIRNWRGRAKGLSGCQHCGGTWNWKKGHDIPYYEGGRSMFPLCRECFEKLDAKTIIDHCKRLMNDWKRMGDGALWFDEKKAMKTIKDYVRKVKGWKGHPAIELVTGKHWKNAKYNGRKKLTK